MDKTALIYEFNNSSPVFAQVAAGELENKNIDKALNILENGIQLFPEYSTAYIVYAQALAMAGDFESAEKMLKKGCDLIESEDTLIYYSNKFEKLKQKTETISTSRRTNFLSDDFDDLNQNDIIDMLAEPEEPVIDEPVEEIDELEKLASELENAKMPVPEPEPAEDLIEDDLSIDEDFLSDEFDDMELEPYEPEEEPEPEPEKKDKEIVSETLAGIYFAQGNYEEALTIYEKLLIFQPEKSEFFKKRIDEIKEQLSE